MIYFDIYHKLTPEEEKLVERHNFLRGSIADSELQINEKMFEYEHLYANKAGDMLPVFVWSGAFLFFGGITLADILVGWDVIVSLSIAIVTCMPLLAGISLVFLIISIRKLLYRYSASEEIMDKAEQKGIINVVARGKMLKRQIEAIRLRITVMKEEIADIEAKFSKNSEENNVEESQS